MGTLTRKKLLSTLVAPLPSTMAVKVWPTSRDPGSAPSDSAPSAIISMHCLLT